MKEDYAFLAKLAGGERHAVSKFRRAVDMKIAVEKI